MRSAAVLNTSSMPRPPSDSVQIAIRIPKAWLALADQTAKAISRPGFEASRTDAFRAAIAAGFVELAGHAAGEPRREVLDALADASREPAPSRPRQKSAKKR